jgi:hypothetical protein
MDDISFKPKRDIHDEIDRKLMQLESHDKVRLLHDVQSNPPEKGEMKVDIPPGMYAIDLRTLLDAQLSDCPATVIPMLIDHGVRVAVDIEKAYKPEKRHLQFEYWWIIFMIVGFGVGFLIINMLFKIF